MTESEANSGKGLTSYTTQPPTTTLLLPPAPEAPLDYPIRFLISSTNNGSDDDNGNNNNNPGGGSGEDVKEVTIFSSLEWLLPLFELAEFLVAKDVRAHLELADKRRKEVEDKIKRMSSTAGSGGVDGESREELEALQQQQQLEKDFPDVASALRLLPLFARFFEEEKKMIPQHSDYYYTITKFTFPTPKGERSVTRSKVEGDSKASFAKPVHAFQNAGNGKAPTLASSTVTNATATFSLLPGHDNFLVYYEKDKLNVSSGGQNKHDSSKPVTVQNKRSAFSLFTYLELDQLRFAFTAVKELIEESKTFNANDGTLSLLAKRDLKKNNLSSAFCLNPKASAAAAAAAEDENNTNSNNNSDSAKPKKASNVITAPRKELLEERRDIAQKRFLKSDLEEECQRRWPHTPISKSLVFVFEEKAEGDLTSEDIKSLGLDEKRIQVNKSKNRRGQKFYLGVAELPLLNKKGGVARFRAARLWNAKKDAESAAAEAALTALRNMK